MNICDIKSIILNISGLVGIMKRPAVGFLTRLEHLRYVQVGWFLKNPTNPVWVTASETHLTGLSICVYFII